MARRSNNEILYKVFQDFINLCLLKDQSLLWPDKELWTRKNVADVKNRMVDSPIFGHDLSFEKKLQKQMDGGHPSYGLSFLIYITFTFCLLPI